MFLQNQSLIEVLKEIANKLQSTRVKYLIVGGTAVNIYGYQRISMGLPPGIDFDIDIWYEPTVVNFLKLTKAIHSLGIDKAEELDKIIFDPNKTFLRIIQGNYKTDFLPFIAGFKIKQFSSSYQNRFNYDLQGTNLTIIGYNDLLFSKKALSREVDLTDIIELQKVNFNT